jgi:hypothetical protein
MAESAEFNSEERNRLYGLSNEEQDKIADFSESLEGRQVIATFFQKNVDDVSDEDGIEAYHKLGPFLFSKEIKLDDMTRAELETKEEEWQKTTQGATDEKTYREAA